MATPKYDVLSLEAFGRRLIETGDLDPVYTAVHAAGLERDQLRRWCLAYWMCYHAGLASWISERIEEDYWGALLQFAYNDKESPIGGRWPRGRERRHFRGDKAISAVDWFHQKFSAPEMPVTLLERLGEGSIEDSAITVPYSYIKNAVTVWPLFGPWIAFKVADMMERLFDLRVVFSKHDAMYDSPTEAALLWVRSVYPNVLAVNPTSEACVHLADNLKDLSAPPTFNRSLGLQEFETVLCKWKAHVNGIYPVGIDSRELLHALTPWARVSPTAARMQSTMYALLTEKEKTHV